MALAAKKGRGRFNSATQLESLVRYYCYCSTYPWKYGPEI